MMETKEPGQKPEQEKAVDNANDTKKDLVRNIVKEAVRESKGSNDQNGQESKGNKMTQETQNQEKKSESPVKPADSSVQKPELQKLKPRTAENKKENGKEQMIAAVLVRGLIGVKHDIKKTIFDSLKLRRKNICIVRKESQQLKGRLIKAKDFITWGEIDDETYKLLVERRSEKAARSDGGKDRSGDGTGIKPFFRLSPPKKGFGRKGIKKPYVAGGALGYRGKDINDLIKRMI